MLQRVLVVVLHIASDWRFYHLLCVNESMVAYNTRHFELMLIVNTVWSGFFDPPGGTEIGLKTPVVGKIER